MLAPSSGSSSYRRGPVTKPRHFVTDDQSVCGKSPLGTMTVLLIGRPYLGSHCHCIGPSLVRGQACSVSSVLVIVKFRYLTHCQLG